MRTKNAKRLWPLPATLTVVALAAFLAFGLMTTTGAQPAEAQDDPCVKVTPGEGGTPTAIAGNDNAEGADGCDSSSSEAIIELAGGDETGATNTTSYVVYGADISGASTGASTGVYPPDTSYGDHDNDADTPPVFFREVDGTDVEVSPLSAVPVTVDPATVDTAGEAVASKETVTVTGSPLDTATVYVAQGTAFTAAVTTTLSNTDVPRSNGKESRTLTRQLVLDIIFLGPPVATAPDEAEATESPDNDNPEPRSNLMITSGDETITATDREVTVTAVVQDREKRDLKGRITYSVEFVEGSALQSGQSSYTTRPVDFDPTNDDASKHGNTHVVKGWATGSAPVIANVSATFTGGGNTIVLPLVEIEDTTDEIEEISLRRAGPLDSVEIVAACYAPLDDETEATKAQEKICGMGMNSEDTPASVNMRPRTVFEAGHVFTIKANAKDMLGSATQNTLSIDLPDTKTEKGAAALTGGPRLTKMDGDDTVIITIDKEAPPDRYMLTVKSSQGTGTDRIYREATVEIIVSGEVAMYEIIGPENIALASFSSAEYTVKATDMQGNPPNFKEGEDMVLVVIESDHSLRVTGLENDMAMLDHETGTDTFTVYKPAGAQSGDTASIGIFVDDMLQDSTMVLFGDAPTAPGMPMNVMAEATSHDMITVTWDAADDGGSDITGYMVQSAYMMADGMMSDWMDVDPAHMGMDMMYMDMGLMAETTYYYRAAAMNSVGMGDYSDGMAMAMTMAENMAPMAGDDVADQMVYVGAMVEVQSNFSDPDEDMLSYTATSDMMDVATATVDSAGMVTITGVAEGMATITVTASDPGELYAMQTIMVTVMTPNMAPMAGDDVADQMVYVGAMVEVQSNFSDPDEDMLSYTATSDMMDVATATVDSAGMVTITGVAEGMATITVTASDPMGESAMQTIMVTVMMMPPMELGAAMDLTATANDDGSITLMWTRGDNATHHFVSGNSAAVWEFAGGMSSHTVSIDKLVSGTEYTFYVISGRFMEADDGTWPGEWSSAGWTNAAKVTVQ